MMNTSKNSRISLLVSISVVPASSLCLLPRQTSRLYFDKEKTTSDLNTHETLLLVGHRIHTPVYLQRFISHAF